MPARQEWLPDVPQSGILQTNLCRPRGVVPCHRLLPVQQGRQSVRRQI